MLFLFALTWLLSPCQKEIYYVSHVNGKVTYLDKKPLKTGDTVTLGNSLRFASDKDWVDVISPVKGRFIIRENPELQTNATNIILSVIKNMVPSTRMGTMASRGGDINSLFDLEHFFKVIDNVDTARLLLTDSIFIPLNENAFDQRDKKYFYLQYQYSGDTINKKLGFVKGTGTEKSVRLLIDKNIYTVDKKPVSADAISGMQLFYYNSAEHTSVPVAVLKPVLVNKAEFLEELRILIKNLSRYYEGNIDAARLIRDELAIHIHDNYGWIDASTLETVIAKISNTKSQMKTALP